MSSAAKTLELLAFFSVARPEIGLSQLCRLAKRDKATAYRHLQALEKTGFVEQNPLSKRYRLGPIVLQLAQVREITVPRKCGAEAALRELANATGETTHVSVVSGTTVYALDSCESPRHSTRAIIDVQTYPLHATASGLCALAFGPKNLFDIATANLQVYTPNTVTTPEALRRTIQSACDTGFACANRSFEDEVHSLAAPVFDQTGCFAGSVSVASVATRFTPDLERCVQRHLMTASREISRNWGGKIPDDIETIWARTLASSHVAENVQ